MESKVCSECGFDEAGQDANRHVSTIGPMMGKCGPGRCVVKGTVWLTYLDGTPTGFDPLEPMRYTAADYFKKP